MVDPPATGSSLESYPSDRSVRGQMGVADPQPDPALRVPQHWHHPPPGPRCRSANRRETRSAPDRHCNDPGGSLNKSSTSGCHSSREFPSRFRRRRRKQIGNGLNRGRCRHSDGIVYSLGRQASNRFGRSRTCRRSSIRTYSYRGSCFRRACQDEFSRRRSPEAFRSCAPRQCWRRSARRCTIPRCENGSHCRTKNLIGTLLCVQRGFISADPLIGWPDH